MKEKQTKKIVKINKKEICHVCGKEKKPYMVIMDSCILSYLTYKQAREKGPICERCDRYFAMTGEFKDASEKEFENAKKASKFSRNMRDWWEKDKKIEFEGDMSREWEGTYAIAKWLRDKLNGVKKHGKKEKRR